jgi:hypothetical protein
LAAFRVGDKVDKKNDIICIANVNGKNKPNIIIQKGVSPKNPNPNKVPLKKVLTADTNE